MTEFLIALVVIILTARIIQFAAYIVIFNIKVCGTGDIGGVFSAGYGQIMGDGSEEEHLRFLATVRSQAEICLIGGSVAVAAWTALFVTSTGGSKARTQISGASLGILLFAALVLISGPICARTRGTFVTYILRESSIYVGFCSMIIALCSVVNDLKPTGWAWPAVCFATLVTLRELWGCGSDLRDFNGWLSSTGSGAHSP